MPKSLTFVGVLIILCCSAVNTQMLTPEMVVDMKTVTSVSIQPQGEYVAYTLRGQRALGADENPRGADSDLWVVSSSGGRAREYVGLPHPVSSIDWTPDGSTITFISLGGRASQRRRVYAIPLDGGEATQLSHAPRSISRYALSPDGRYLAYSMLDEEPEDVRTARALGFDQQVEDTWSTIARVYVEDLSAGTTHLVTRRDLHVVVCRLVCKSA